MQLKNSPSVFSYSLLQTGASLLKLSLINTQAKTLGLYTIKITTIFGDVNLELSSH